MDISKLTEQIMKKVQDIKTPVIGIDGLGGAGKSTICETLCTELSNYGYQVIDLGKDVSRDVIVQTAKENNASIIALSALMTTTMQEMKHVIKCAKEQGVTSKFMIGGAVITNDYAEEIGADGYSRDAADAVKVAMKLAGITEE